MNSNDFLKMKYIDFKTSHNRTIRVPFNVLAEKRADYYACIVDGHEKYSDEWDEEYRFSLGDEYETLDYARGSLNLEDLFEIDEHEVIKGSYPEPERISDAYVEVVE